MAMPEPNVVVRQHRNGQLSVYVGGVFMGGVTAVTYRSEAGERYSRLIVEVIGQLVTFEHEE